MILNIPYANVISDEEQMAKKHLHRELFTNMNKMRGTSSGFVAHKISTSFENGKKWFCCQIKCQVLQT